MRGRKKRGKEMGEVEEEERGETDLHLLIIPRTQPVIFLTSQQTIWCGFPFDCIILLRWNI